MMSCDEGFALERRPNCFAAESDVAVAPSCVDQTTTAEPAAEDGETERQRRRKGGKKGGRNGGGKKKGGGDASRRLCEAGQRMQCDEGLELKRRPMCYAEDGSSSAAVMPSCVEPAGESDDAAMLMRGDEKKQKRGGSGAGPVRDRLCAEGLMMSCDEGFALERRPNCFAAESDVAVAPSCVDQTTTARPAAEDGETERQRRRKGGKKGGRNGGGKKKGG